MYYETSIKWKRTENKHSSCKVFNHFISVFIWIFWHILTSVFNWITPNELHLFDILVESFDQIENYYYLLMVAALTWNKTVQYSVMRWKGFEQWIWQIMGMMLINWYHNLFSLSSTSFPFHPFSLAIVR